ncbi:MAG: RHS repeat-associated core domain-containing protein [Kosmotogaceae bacterium]
MNTEKTSLSWYFHGARYFDPQLALWHSPDPLSESSTSLSPYTYVANNPVNLVDPNGMLYAKPSDWEREQAKEGAYCSAIWWKMAGMMGSQFGSYMDRYPSGGWEFCAPTGGYVNRFTGERMSADEFNKTYLSYSAASFSGNLLSARKIRVGTHGWISNDEVYGAPSYMIVYTMNSPWNQNTRDNALNEGDIDQGVDEIGFDLNVGFGYGWKTPFGSLQIKTANARLWKASLSKSGSNIVGMNAGQDFPLLSLQGSVPLINFGGGLSLHSDSGLDIFGTIGLMKFSMKDGTYVDGTVGVHFSIWGFEGYIRTSDYSSFGSTITNYRQNFYETTGFMWHLR